MIWDIQVALLGTLCCCLWQLKLISTAGFPLNIPTSSVVQLSINDQFFILSKGSRRVEYGKINQRCMTLDDQHSSMFTPRTNIEARILLEVLPFLLNEYTMWVPVIMTNPHKPRWVSELIDWSMIGRELNQDMCTAVFHGAPSLLAQDECSAMHTIICSFKEEPDNATSPLHYPITLVKYIDGFEHTILPQQNSVAPQQPHSPSSSTESSTTVGITEPIAVGILEFIEDSPLEHSTLDSTALVSSVLGQSFLSPTPTLKRNSGGPTNNQHHPTSSSTYLDNLTLSTSIQTIEASIEMMHTTNSGDSFSTIAPSESDTFFDNASEFDLLIEHFIQHATSIPEIPEFDSLFRNTQNTVKTTPLPEFTTVAQNEEKTTRKPKSTTVAQKEDKTTPKPEVTTSTQNSQNKAESTTTECPSESTTKSTTCPCDCSNLVQIQNITPKAIQELTKSIETKLIVNTSSLSSTIRKKTSAYDSRPSSKLTGMMGVCSLAFTFGSIMVLDLVSLLKFLTNRLSNFLK